MNIRPSESEKRQLEILVDQQRLHYFLTRTLESEEVWGLGDETGWVMNSSSESTSLPVWPYACLASDNAGEEWNYCKPLSMSLEHFLYNTLPHMSQHNILVDVFPYQQSSGTRLSAAQLADMIESMMDSGEYYLEA